MIIVIDYLVLKCNEIYATANFKRLVLCWLTASLECVHLGFKFPEDPLVLASATR